MSEQKPRKKQKISHDETDSDSDATEREDKMKFCVYRCHYCRTVGFYDDPYDEFQIEGHFYCEECYYLVVVPLPKSVGAQD